MVNATPLPEFEKVGRGCEAGEALKDEDVTGQGELDDGILRSYRQVDQAQLEKFCRLLSDNNIDDATELLAKSLNLWNHRQDPREHLPLVFTTLALELAHKRHLSLSKMGVIFNITQTLLASITRGDNRQDTESVFRDCFTSLIKAHPAKDEPHFTAFDIQPFAIFCADHILKHHSLFHFVLLKNRKEERADVSRLVEIPFLPEFGSHVYTEQEWQDRLKILEEESEKEKRDAEEKALAEKESQDLAMIEKQRLDAEFKRKQELAMKPENLEQAVDKLIKWRIENEKLKIQEGYKKKISQLEEQISQLKPNEPSAKKPGK